MKILAILLLLSTVAFASDPLLEPVSILESNNVVYVIDATPEEYVAPEPVDTSISIPKWMRLDVIDVLDYFWIKSLEN